MDKRCSKCKEDREISYFGKNGSKKDGLQDMCNECRKNYREENKELIKKQNQNYRVGNKEVLSHKRKQRYKRDRDKESEQMKRYREENKELISSQRKLNYINNREDILSKCEQHSQNDALYDTYHHQLTIDEDPRLSSDGVSLEVRCKYCGKYFKPTNREVRNRITALKGDISNNNLYCSDGCRYSCSIFGQKKYPKDHKPATSREVQSQLRKLVLERDNWTCQKCGETDTLHCHHYEGVEINPIESADMDNCITLCKKCHNESHQQDGCDMKRGVC